MSDQELYKKYGLTDDEIAFVERVIRPMDLADVISEDFADGDDDE